MKLFPQRRKGSKITQRVFRSSLRSLLSLRLCVKISLSVLATIALLTSCSRKPSGALAFVTNERDGTITVIDTGSDRVFSTIKVGGRLRGIRLNADRSRVWVAISYPTNQTQGEDKIAELDLNGNVIAKYEAGTDPENFVLDDAATRLYIANEDAGTASITDVKANRVISRMAVGLEPEGAAMSPDGRWVYITSEASSSVSVIDTRTGDVVKTFLVGARPREAVFTADSARAYVTAENGNAISVVETKDHTVTKTLELPPGEGAAKLKPKGVVVSNRRQTGLCGDRSWKQRGGDRRRTAYVDHIDSGGATTLGTGADSRRPQALHRQRSLKRRLGD